MSWKDEFVKLFMSNDINDFSRALELKRTNVPRKLYRFRSIKTDEKLAQIIDEIVLGQLYMAHPNELNDPFEMSSPLISKNSADYFGQGSFRGSKFDEAVIQCFGEDKARELQSCGDWYNQLMLLFAEEFKKGHGHSETEFVSIMEKIVMKQVEDLNKSYNSIFALSRIASFTENCRSLPMWNHYADAYSGVCFEFAASDIEREILYINKLFPIIYVNKLPDAVQNGFAELHNPNSKPPFGIKDYVAFHKLVDWSYEQEWRLIFNIGDFYYSLKEVPREYYSTGRIVNFARPSKIILGYHICEVAESKIRKAAEMFSIPVVKMIITQYGFEEQIAMSTHM